MSIHIMDNVAGEHYQKLIEKEVRNVKLHSGWKARGIELNNWHWHHSIFQDTRLLPAPTEEHMIELKNLYPYTIGVLWPAIQKRILDQVDYKCDFVRAYINAHTYGVDGLIHTDDGDYTAIYYPFSNWNPEWEGGTCFYNKEKNDAIHYSSYVTDRLIVFPATIPHRAMPVTRECYGLRSVVVFKCVIDVNHPSYARKYYLDNQPKE